MSSIERTRRPELLYVMGGQRVNSDGREYNYDGDPIHQDIAELAMAHLTEPHGQGYFSKDGVIDELSEKNPYIAHMLKEQEA
mgnify:CR=1 FL=1